MTSTKLRGDLGQALMLEFGGWQEFVTPRVVTYIAAYMQQWGRSMTESKEALRDRLHKELQQRERAVFDDPAVRPA